MKISYKKGVTINTGNFESERYELMVEDDIEVGEIGSVAMDSLISVLKHYVDSKIAECGVKKVVKGSNSDVDLKIPF